MSLDLETARRGPDLFEARPTTLVASREAVRSLEAGEDGGERLARAAAKRVDRLVKSDESMAHRPPRRRLPEAAVKVRHLNSAHDGRRCAALVAPGPATATPGWARSD
ncbi:hypothetical protein L6V77_02765 [Myxococcota bacterium]|nr:hypothetical protein [Myxococcota bacterium]